jgi:deoxyribodipyrimidine photo-lyase
MQAGTTGINAIRIYSPTKQARDQDPEGIFIRQWVPELGYIHNKFIHTPWSYPEKVNDYPSPIVEESHARRGAADRMHSLRKSNGFANESKEVFKRHGSRARVPRKPSIKSHQLDLF